MKKTVLLLLLLFISLLLFIPAFSLADSVKTYDDAGNCILEMFFNEDGTPEFHNNSYYGVSWKYENGKCVEITYLDASGNPMMNKSRYAIVKRVVDDAGHVVKEMYYDVNGRSTSPWGNQYGLTRNAFDEEGRCVDYTYLDKEGNPTLTTSGYSRVKRKYNKDGKVDVNMYYDVDGNPVKLSLGQYGEKYEYDAEGHNISTTYLGIDGEPIITKTGYTTLKRDYENDRISVEWYYDINGNQVSLHRGQYGTRFVYDEKGTVKERISVDKDGNDIFLLEQYLPQHPWLIVLGGLLVIIAGIMLPKKPVLILYTLFILYMTLYVRETSEDAPVSFELFRSVKNAIESSAGWTSWAQIINNILLFIPFGFVLYSIRPKLSSFFIPLLFSVLIETIQLITGLGWCELDDVVWNTLGGSVGIGLGMLQRRIAKKSTGGRYVSSQS